MIPQFVKRIRIGAVDIEVWLIPDLVDEQGNDVFGTWDAHENRICVRSGMTDRETWATYAHEVCHAADSIFELGIDETDVRVLEAALVAAFLG